MEVPGRQDRSTGVVMFESCDIDGYVDDTEELWSGPIDTPSISAG